MMQRLKPGFAQDNQRRCIKPDKFFKFLRYGEFIITIMGTNGYANN